MTGEEIAAIFSKEAIVRAIQLLEKEMEKDGSTKIMQKTNL